MRAKAKFVVQRIQSKTVLDHRKKFLRLDVRVVFGLPGGVVALRERTAIIDLDRQKQRATRAHVEFHAGVGLAALSENEHNGPLGTSEDTDERLAVG